jgi:hypothetical protein
VYLYEALIDESGHSSILLRSKERKEPIDLSHHLDCSSRLHVIESEQVDERTCDAWKWNAGGDKQIRLEMN